MSTGEATILLELDKTRRMVWGGDGNRIVERTGWKRFLTLTKMLHKAKAVYDVEFEFIDRDHSLPFNGTVQLCDGARIKARIVWVIAQ